MSLFSWIFAPQVQVLTAQVQALSGQVQTLHSALQDSNSRFDRVYGDLITTFKAELNWRSSAMSNRPVYPDVPLADATTSANRYRDRDGSPVPVNTRGGNARRESRVSTDKFLKQYLADQASKLAQPETQEEMAASVPEAMLDETDPLDRLVLILQEQEERRNGALAG